VTDLDAPLEHWMVHGGDRRQVLDPHTGLNKYRITAGPRPGVPFGSCTASWPTERAWQAASAALATWREAPDTDEALEAAAEGIRARLATVLGLDGTDGLVLTPSGTDAVYLVSAWALRGVGRIHHVVVGASELGGGTLTAARSRTFSDRVPHGGSVEVGAPVPGLDGSSTAEPLYLRDESGDRRTLDEVDALVLGRVREALSRVDRVVIHLVAHSKTGLRAPSLSCMDALIEEHGGRVQVLVDAAQGRLAPHDVRTALERGFMVLFTGSKFYGGPPFSSLLVLPRPTDPGPLPEGLDQWLARSDLPRAWRRARSALPVAHNPGLLLRWVAALAEIEAYHAIEPRRRGRVYHTFAGAVLECFGPSPQLEVDVPLPPVHRLVTGLGAYPSVFGFRVFEDGEELGAPSLARLHALLDTDLGARDPALGRRFHLGQPVALGKPREGAPAVLRVALGARLVTDLATTPDAGAAWLRTRMGEVRMQIERIVAAGLHREDL
jgi:hypothetical protein